MSLFQHLINLVLRLYSWIYDLLGLGVLVNIVFRAVVRGHRRRGDGVARHPPTGDAASSRRNMPPLTTTTCPA